MKTLISTITEKATADPRFSKDMPYPEYIELWIEIGEKMHREFLEEGLVQTAEKVKSHVNWAKGEHRRTPGPRM